MTPDQMRDASLLELFSLEADAQTQVLSAGLLALERNPTQADQLEACMRAAHSLKGAARIVGVDAGVSVAHVMEDCLVSAQESRLYLQPEHIDALLQGTDLLMRIATPGNSVGPADIQAYVALMERLLDPSQPAAKVVAPPPVTAPPAQPLPPLEESLLLPPEPEAAPPVSSDTPRQNKRMTEGGERVLRVTAERLNSLLDLSSKSLVETQRLKPYLASLQRFYAPDFKSASEQPLAQWLTTLTPSPDQRGRSIEIKDKSYLRWTDSQDTMVVTFGEVPEGARTGTTRRQYWTRKGTQWQIFYEGVTG